MGEAKCIVQASAFHHEQAASSKGNESTLGVAR